MRIVKKQNKDIQKRHIQRHRNNAGIKQYKSKYFDQELNAMQRSPVRQKPHSTLFCRLTQQLFWDSFINKHN